MPSFVPRLGAQYTYGEGIDTYEREADICIQTTMQIQLLIEDN